MFNVFSMCVYLLALDQVKKIHENATQTPHLVLCLCVDLLALE
jgi:hypothetical protein